MSDFSHHSGSIRYSTRKVGIYSTSGDKHTRLRNQMRLTWTQLYRQFGVNPARATDQGTVDNFRRDCLRELQKIKRSWTDLHYRTVKGALLLSPSPPVIAPSQLRLVG